MFMEKMGIQKEIVQAFQARQKVWAEIWTWETQLAFHSTIKLSLIGVKVYNCDLGEKVWDWNYIIVQGIDCQIKVLK